MVPCNHNIIGHSVNIKAGPIQEIHLMYMHLNIILVQVELVIRIVRRMGIASNIAILCICCASCVLIILISILAISF